MDGRRFYYPAPQFQTYYVDPPLQQRFPSYSVPQAANSQDSSPVAASTPSSSESEGRRSYDRWSTEEENMLIDLWAENFDRIESREARKAWDDIAQRMNDKFGTKRATEKYQKKMKYLIERYKQAKDWNSKQTGGNPKKSAHYDQIDAVLGCRDIVTLANVKEAGTATKSEGEPAGDAVVIDRREARSSRKKNKKREREETDEEGDRKMFRDAFSGLEAQRNDMNVFVNNFTRMQERQLKTMNALLGALTNFLEKQ